MRAYTREYICLSDEEEATKTGWQLDCEYFGYSVIAITYYSWVSAGVFLIAGMGGVVFLSVVVPLLILLDHWIGADHRSTTMRITEFI